MAGRRAWLRCLAISTASIKHVAKKVAATSNVSTSYRDQIESSQEKRRERKRKWRRRSDVQKNDPKGNQLSIQRHSKLLQNNKEVLLLWWDLISCYCKEEVKSTWLLLELVISYKLLAIGITVKLNSGSRWKGLCTRQVKKFMILWLLTTSWHEVLMDNSPTWEAGGIWHCYERLNKWIAANNEYFIPRKLLDMKFTVMIRL